MSPYTNDLRKFFGSISLYHTASENLLRAILVRTKLRGPIENPLQTAGVVQALQSVCTNELFVPHMFSSASPVFRCLARLANLPRVTNR